MRVGLVLPVALLMAANSWGVNYIDYDGVEKTKSCTQLTTSNSESLGSGNCFVVQGQVDLSLSGKRLKSSGDLELILADGAELKVNYSGDDAFAVGSGVTMSNLTIYGQKGQTGTMIVSGKGGTFFSTIGQTGRGMHVHNLVINGGIISVSSESSDGIYATGNVTINGGSVSVSTTSSNSSHNGLKGDNITLGWRNLTDYVKVSSFSGTVKIASGKAFKDESGNVYEAGTTLSSDQKMALKNKYLRPYAPVVFDGDKAIVDGDYTGSVAVDFPEGKTVDVSSIDYLREYTDDVAATIVLPFSLPTNAVVNAKFYGLRTIEQDGCRWVARMQNIGAGNLPAANTPYIVKVQGTTLTFDLKGGMAHFQTQASANHEVSTEDESGNWYFMANYSYRTWANDADLSLYYALAGKGDQEGRFGKVSSDSYAPAMRSYFKKKSSNVQIVCSTPSGRPAALGESAIVSEIPEVIDVELIDEGEHTTFVGRMNTHTGEIQMKRDYDLKGRKLNGAPTARGAYYGKKVIKK